MSGCSKRFDMSQHWPLSQTAGKFSSTCSVCLATRQLHLKDGKIHRHGPRDNPCAGSNKPPLDAVNVLSLEPGACSAKMMSPANDRSRSVFAFGDSWVYYCIAWIPPSANDCIEITKDHMEVILSTICDGDFRLCIELLLD